MGYFVQTLSVPATERSNAFASSREARAAPLWAESTVKYIGAGSMSWLFGLLRRPGVNA
jgi:hypothetical protein